MKSIIFFVVFSVYSYADFPIFSAKEINGKFINDKGFASASSISYKLPKISIKHSEIDLNFDRVEKSLLITDEATSAKLDFDFSFLNVFKAFRFGDISINSIPNRFESSIDLLNLFINNQTYKMSGISLFSDIGVTQFNGKISLIDGILLKSILEIEKVKFAKFNPDIFNLFIEENLSVQNNFFQDLIKCIKDKKLPKMIIRHTKFEVNEGKFTGVAIVDSYMNLMLRMNGTINSNEDNSEIIIKLNKAKLGLFSIRSTIIKRIDRLGLNGVSVNGNTIRVVLKPESY